ncbi:MAG: hypothetical protein E7Z87_06945 [Cyanobacteria bacterium SIG26]|nr:hypothetical protein [Cyanobacteria bacterium SIG26]
MNIGRITNLSFTSTPSRGGVGINGSVLDKEMERLQREDLANVGKVYQEEAFNKLNEQHTALFTALNAQMVQNQFELLNRLDKIEKKVNDIHWQTGGKYTDPLAPFM